MKQLNLIKKYLQQSYNLEFNGNKAEFYDYDFATNFILELAIPQYESKAVLLNIYLTILGHKHDLTYKFFSLGGAYYIDKIMKQTSEFIETQYNNYKGEKLK